MPRGPLLATATTRLLHHTEVRSPRLLLRSGLAKQIGVWLAFATLAERSSAAPPPRQHAAAVPSLSPLLLAFQFRPHQPSDKNGKRRKNSQEHEKHVKGQRTPLEMGR
ncbi:hypothetical protein U9M48_001118 [Paspalum notatum var. saurae]|uniref:Uncharacterized protein n=1 Tax=Paspalum notatum var. saurae TaxID=547442 RepID=A0AAQ3PMU7_PASNO